MTEETNTNRFQQFGNFSWPVILILSGIVLLLNNFGIVSWEVWNVIFRFWPILLIIAGLDSFGDNNFFAKLVSTIIIVTLVFFVFAFAISSVNQKFDRYIASKLPVWNKIKNSIPFYQQHQRIQRCNPFEENCQMYYKWN